MVIDFSNLITYTIKHNFQEVFDIRKHFQIISEPNRDDLEKVSFYYSSSENM